jgi:hypothetical protein
MAAPFWYRTESDITGRPLDVEAIATELTNRIFCTRRYSARSNRIVRQSGLGQIQTGARCSSTRAANAETHDSPLS